MRPFAFAFCAALLALIAPCSHALAQMGGNPTAVSGPPPGLDNFYSPGLSSAYGGTGATTYTYVLPSLTTGRLRVTAIGNGSPGWSGAISAAGAIAVGGPGGGPGGEVKTFDIPISTLVALYPSITQIYINFGSLGTPGAAVTGSSATAGAQGPKSSDVLLYVNNASGALLNFSGALGYNGIPAGNITSSAAGAALVGGSTGITGGGQASATGLAGGSAPSQLNGPTGGGAGAGLDASNNQYIGGYSGRANENIWSAAPISGGAVAAVGVSPAGVWNGPACIGGIGGGGGGSSNSTTTASSGNGADASGYGSGGGGGAAGRVGAASGAGGHPAWGCIDIQYLPF